MRDYLRVSETSVKRQTENKMKPQIGLRFNHPTLGNVVIIAIHPLGTIDVRNIYTDRCYRITGLPMA